MKHERLSQRLLQQLSVPVRPEIARARSRERECPCDDTADQCGEHHCGNTDRIESGEGSEKKQLSDTCAYPGFELPGDLTRQVLETSRELRMDREWDRERS